MATTYAAYYNIMTAQKANDSRRTSGTSTASNGSKFSLKGVVDQLRPTTEKITPSGIYAPVIKQGPLFSGLKPAEEAQEPTPVWQRKRPLFSFGEKDKTSAASSMKHSSIQTAVDAALLR